MSFEPGIYELKVVLTDKQTISLPGTVHCQFVDQLMSHVKHAMDGFSLFNEGVVVTYPANAIFKVEAFKCEPYED